MNLITCGRMVTQKLSIYNCYQYFFPVFLVILELVEACGLLCMLENENNFHPKYWERKWLI